MANNFDKLTEPAAIDTLTEQSKDGPVVIFKHSLTCPISAAAFDQMEVFEGRVSLVEVQKARELSNEIETRLGVPHESPQVIVMRNGQVVWNASHFKITSDAVAKAVAEAKNGRPADKLV
ncbi:MAG TPA: bacillithiol system redox-active protein YtxJ [Pyrinomonadaceae bacterium]|nr:bacillithiol system redox-active protein YtxJ [Pyrinomonadaceae bacterium]